MEVRIHSGNELSHFLSQNHEISMVDPEVFLVCGSVNLQISQKVDINGMTLSVPVPRSPPITLIITAPLPMLSRNHHYRSNHAAAFFTFNDTHRSIKLRS